MSLTIHIYNNQKFLVHICKAHFTMSFNLKCSFVYSQSKFICLFLSFFLLFVTIFQVNLPLTQQYHSWQVLRVSKHVLEFLMNFIMWNKKTWFQNWNKKKKEKFCKEWKKKFKVLNLNTISKFPYQMYQNNWRSTCTGLNFMFVYIDLFILNVKMQIPISFEIHESSLWHMWIIRWNFLMYISSQCVFHHTFFNLFLCVCFFLFGFILDTTQHL